MTAPRPIQFLLTILPLGAMVWATAIFVADAEDQKTEQASIAEAVIELKDIHVKQQTAEEARAKLIRELCAAGKLPEADCK